MKKLTRNQTLTLLNNHRVSIYLMAQKKYNEGRATHKLVRLLYALDESMKAFYDISQQLDPEFTSALDFSPKDYTSISRRRPMEEKPLTPTVESNVVVYSDESDEVLTAATRFTL